MTVADALSKGKSRLQPVTDTPALEAALLLAVVLNCTRTHLLAWPTQALSLEQLAAYDDFIQRRASGIPVAYLTGQKEFWSMNLSVSPATLIPRPATETLVETVLALFPLRDGFLRVADLGTGSGAIALALQCERPHWEVHATDLSQEALHVASNNAHQFGCERIAFHLGSWCNALPAMTFDLIVSNPPYLSLAEWPEYASGLVHEPFNALVSGNDGLLAIREIVTTAASTLAPGGVLVIEHGFLQAEAVSALFLAAGYLDIGTVNDAASHPRVTHGRRAH